MQNKCTSYNYDYIDFLVPPSDILESLCSSKDKTYLFIISFFRVLTLMLIAKILFETTRAKKFTLIIFCSLLIYIIINITILFLIIIKQINK